MTEDPRAAADQLRRRRVPDAGDVVGRHIARVAGIFDAAPIGVSVWSTDGELLHANPVQCDLLRASRAELVGQRFEEFIEPNAAAAVRRGVADLWSGDRNHFGARLRCFDADGGERWLRAELTAVYGPDARPAYLLAQVFDFTGLRDADEGGPDLLEQAPAMLWMTDDRGIPRRGSPAAHRFVGSAPEDGDLAQGFFEHTHPDDFDRLGGELRKRVRERLPLDFVARARRADGSWRWMRNEARPFFDDRGTFVGYVGTSVDVSEYEELRAELDATRSLFRTVTEAGPLAVAASTAAGCSPTPTGGGRTCSTTPSRGWPV